jgi:hypothetical protein
MRKSILLLLLVGMVLLGGSCTQPVITGTPVSTVPEIINTITPSEEVIPIKDIQYNLLFTKENRFYLFDPLNVKTRHSVLSANSIYDVTFSPDGSLLAFVDNSGIYLSKYPFDSSVKIAASYPEWWGHSLEFNSTGNQLAYTDQNGLNVWEVASSSATLLLAHPEPVRDNNFLFIPHRWSPDGQWLVISKSTFHYGKYWIVNTTTKQMLQVLNDPQEIVWLDNTRMIATVDYDCRAQTGLKDGIYALEIVYSALVQQRIYHEAENPECGERGYYIEGLDLSNGRIFFDRSGDEGSTSPTLQSLAITLDGTLLPDVSGDCYTLEGATVLPDGRLLCESKQNLYIFNPISSETEIIFDHSEYSRIWFSLPTNLSPDHTWLLYKENNQYFLLDLISQTRYKVILDAPTDEVQFLGWTKLD